MQVSLRFHNNTYAPGIATYGIDGKTGNTGLPGTSMFFTDFDLTSEFINFAHKITSRMIPIKLKEIVLDRKYVNGDYFVTMTGEIYMLTDINTLTIASLNNDFGTLDDYFIHVGKFSTENNDLFINSDTTINASTLILTDTDNVENNQESLLTLNRINKGIGLVNFINMNALYGNTANMNLNISYDNTLKAFKFYSQYPIVIDSNVYVKQDSSIQTSLYSPVLTTNNGITNFYSICNDITYNIDASIYTYTEQDSSALYYGSVYIITLNNNNKLNTLKNNDITLHFQNNNYQDFQQYRETDTTYYFKQNYKYVSLNDIISKVLRDDLNNIQISLIYNLEIYIKKQNTNLIGYKI